jgi:hypothetical protein
MTKGVSPIPTPLAAGGEPRRFFALVAETEFAEMTAIASAAHYQRLQRTRNTLCKPLIQRREFVTHGYDIRYSAERRSLI